MKSTLLLCSHLDLDHEPVGVRSEHQTACLGDIRVHVCVYVYTCMWVSMCVYIKKYGSTSYVGTGQVQNSVLLALLNVEKIKSESFDFVLLSFFLYSHAALTNYRVYTNVNLQMEDTQYRYIYTNIKINKLN